MLIHSIICDQDVREALVKAFVRHETKGLRFKFYSGWDFFWDSLDISDLPHAMGQMALCFDIEPERPLPQGCQKIKLSKQMSHCTGEVYLYQPIEHLIAGITNLISGLVDQKSAETLQIKWLFAPRLGDVSLKQIEDFILKRTSIAKAVMVLNLSFWRLPSYLCTEFHQQSVSEYLLAHKAYTDKTEIQTNQWPIFISTFKHPMDLMWVNESALQFIETASRNCGAKELIVVSSLLPTEAMKFLTLKAQQVAVICENDSDEPYREPFKKWMAFYHPDIDFVEKGLGVLV